MDCSSRCCSCSGVYWQGAVACSCRASSTSRSASHSLLSGLSERERMKDSSPSNEMVAFIRMSFYGFTHPAKVQKKGVRPSPRPPFLAFFKSISRRSLPRLFMVHPQGKVYFLPAGGAMFFLCGHIVFCYGYFVRLSVWARDSRRVSQRSTI